MPTIQDLIDELKRAGVTIEGEGALRDHLDFDSHDYASVIALLRKGRKVNLFFLRSPAVSEAALFEILQGYFPQPATVRHVIQNIRLH